ncbi:MAG: hypothetical protein AB7U79_06735 [Candidatus Izemoplasmatales bacterium]
MQQDIKKINKQFLFNLLLFVGILALLVGGSIAVLIFYPNDAMKYVIIFFAMIVMIVVASVFKTILERITNISYLIKIMNNAGGPLPLNYGRYPDKFANNLVNIGFTRYSMNPKYTLYYRISKDFIKKTFRRHVLELVVHIHSASSPFYLDDVDVMIGKIQQEELKKGVRFDKMLITQVKDVLELNDETKKQLKEIIFVKTKYSVISTINVGLHQASAQAVMMYATNYSPSLYYAHHIETIKKII